ncbi:uncharacterized protein ACNFOS_002103 [Eudromia elegans]
MGRNNSGAGQRRGALNRIVWPQRPRRLQSRVQLERGGRASKSSPVLGPGTAVHDKGRFPPGQSALNKALPVPLALGPVTSAGHEDSLAGGHGGGGGGSFNGTAGSALNAAGAGGGPAAAVQSEELGSAVESKSKTERGAAHGGQAPRCAQEDSHADRSYRSLRLHACGVGSMSAGQNGCANGAALTCVVMDKKEPQSLPTAVGLNGGYSTSGSHEEEVQGDKLSPSKIMRFFSAPRKRANSNSERPRSLILMGNSSTWNALSSIRKMGSFKKLRSSVLQGIQTRECPDILNENSAGNHGSNGAVVRVHTNRYSYSGPLHDFQDAVDGLASDCSDAEEGDDSFLRNTHRSRSIRRAYGVGRINLLDTDKAQSNHKCTRPASPGVSEPKICEILVKDSENNRIVYRRSKSSDNLNFLKKSSFKRKSTSNLTDLKAANEKQMPQRTVSAPSADSDKTHGNSERRSKRWKSPIRAKDFDRVLKLVSNVTDVAWKKDGPKSTDPAAGEQPQRARPNSRLHDDYSRRVSSSTEHDRKRCTSPARSPGSTSPGTPSLPSPAKEAAANGAAAEDRSVSTSSGILDSPSPIDANCS